MREIRYRAWGFENSEMIEVGKIEFFTDGTFHINDELPSEFQGKELWRLMQYTGLKDKHDVPIFEGDIVRMDSWSPSEIQIGFIEGAFCLADKNGEYVADIHYVQHAGRKQAEVIGNIHEHGHLLTPNT